MAYGDNPICASTDDQLERNPAVRALSALLVDEKLDTPIAIGIYGAWGSGKTSVMNLMRAELGKHPKHLVIDFAAWRYAHHEDALWRAMLLDLIESLRVESHRKKLAEFKLGPDASVARLDEEAHNIDMRLERLRDRLYRSVQWTEKGDIRIKWGALLPMLFRAAANLLPGGNFGVDALLAGLGDKEKVKEVLNIVERESKTLFAEQLSGLEQFRAEFGQLVHDYFASCSVAGSPRRLYVFVDDLDRCLPEDAVSALEAIKTFLDVPGVVFTLGMDRKVIEQGIRVRYSKLESPAGESPVDASQYLDKIVQVPFTLPPLGHEQIELFVDKWCEHHGEDAIRNHCRTLIVCGVAANPRLVKRTLNLIRLLRLLRSSYAGVHRELEAPELQRLAVLAVLQTSYRRRYEIAIRSPQEVRELEKRARARSLDAQDPEAARLQAMFNRLQATNGAFTEMEDNELTQLLQMTRFSSA